MSFSASDLAAVKSAVQADPTALGYWNAGNRGACSNYLNAVPASGATTLTRKDVSNTELFHALAASEVVALSAGQQTLLQLAGLAGRIDFTNPNVTSGLTAIFPTTTQTYKNIMGIAQRSASRLEAIFTTGGVCSQYGATIDVPTLIEAMA